MQDPILALEKAFLLVSGINIAALLFARPRQMPGLLEEEAAPSIAGVDEIDQPSE